MNKKLNVAIIGHRFMGRAHSNSWKQAPKFFTLEAEPVLKVACGRDKQELRKFADNWSWEEISTDWESVFEREDIDIIDIATPTHLHHEMAIKAAKCGKHIFCEKPFALNLQQAESMLEAAQSANIIHYLNHNYRRCPAIVLAKKMISEGKLGRIYHLRSSYQQDWLANPDTQMGWQLDHELSGGGPHIDLGSHCIDLAHHLVGNISSISCLQAHFVKERRNSNNTKQPINVDDASIMSVEFDNGAVGSFECTRYASGRKNRNYFEINGSEGSLVFDLEKMNELEYFSSNDPSQEQGFRKIIVTEPNHDYVKNWWPPGHIIGYEHTFVHSAADFINSIVANNSITPNFQDGVNCMRVLDAGNLSAKTGQRVSIAH